MVEFCYSSGAFILASPMIKMLGCKWSSKVIFANDTRLKFCDQNSVSQTFLYQNHHKPGTAIMECLAINTY